MLYYGQLIHPGGIFHDRQHCFLLLFLLLFYEEKVIAICAAKIFRELKRYFKTPHELPCGVLLYLGDVFMIAILKHGTTPAQMERSEEHTSELQSR